MTDKQIIQELCRGMRRVLADIYHGSSLGPDHKSIKSIRRLSDKHRKNKSKK
jgi:hypothetical protein